MGRLRRSCYALQVSESPLLHEAIESVRRDPTRAVQVVVDSQLTIEVRAIEQEHVARKSAADAFREIGRWEGETGEALDALFAGQRQPLNRSVDELP